MNFRLVDRIRVTVEKVDHISQKVGHNYSRLLSDYSLRGFLIA